MQDALRLYLINSPVVRAEPLRFKKEGVYGVVSVGYLLSFYGFLIGFLSYFVLLLNHNDLKYVGFVLFHLN